MKGRWAEITLGISTSWLWSSGTTPCFLTAVGKAAPLPTLHGFLLLMGLHGGSFFM